MSIHTVIGYHTLQSVITSDSQIWCCKLQMRDWPCVDTHLPCAAIAHRVWSTGFPCKMALCVEQSHPVQISTYPMWSLIILCSGQFQQAVTIHLMQSLTALCGEWSPCAASELPVYSAEVAKCVTSLRSCHNHSCSNIDILLQGRSVTVHCTRWIVPHTWLGVTPNDW